MVLYERNGEDIDRGLIGYWKLDDKKNGSSVAIDRAKFNDGVITGATNTEGINGLNPDAMDFNGVDDFVNIGNQTIIKETISTKFSISFSTKPGLQVAGDNKGVISTRGVGPFVTLTENSSAEGADTKMRFRVNDGVNNLNNDISSGKTQGEWTNWIYTVEIGSATGGKIYRDGELALTQDLSSIGSIQNDNDFIFGKEVTIHFKGTIQNVRLYNRVLTAGEASKIARLKL